MRRPLFFASLVFAAAVYLFLSFFPIDHSEYDALNGERARVTGTLDTKEISLKSDGTKNLKLTLKDISGTISGDDTALSTFKGEILVTLSPEDMDIEALSDKLRIGQTIVVLGKLRSFKEPSNPGEFDSSLYYRTQNLYLAIYNATLVKVSGRGDALPDLLNRIRERLGSVFDKTLPGDDAGIMKACLLGERGSLSTEIKDLYRDSGIIHILAISGLHISLFGMGLYKILKKLGLRMIPSAVLSGVFILLYAGMVHLRGSGLRAVLMFLVFLGAGLARRSYDLLTAMALSLLLLLIQQPEYIRYSGFQFSFLAILGIGLLLPVFHSKLMKAVAIPAALLPVTLVSYGTFPLWSIFLNLAVIPLLSVIMVLGVILCLMGSAFLPAGLAISYPLRLLLYFYRSASAITQELPLHQIVLGQPARPLIFLYYLILVLLIVRTERRRVQRRKEEKEWKKALWVLFAVLLLVVRDRRGLSLDIIDVGQGDGILIEADGSFITIDGGSSSESELGRYVLMPFLHAKGVGHIDIAVLTHDDSDHCSGLIYLLENGYDIRKIVLADMGDVPMEDRGENYLKVEELARQRNIPVTFLSRGNVLKQGKLQMVCVHPSSEESYLSDVNQDSVTFLLTYGGFSALLTGDLEQQGEEDCLAYCRSLEKKGGLDKPSELTVLKCGHHGSKYATSAEWLSYWDPKFSVISCGLNNVYHHPADETMERLEDQGTTVLDTRYDGEIEFRTNGNKLKIKRYLDG